LPRMPEVPKIAEIGTPGLNRASALES
jgi:hypothetical protein